MIKTRRDLQEYLEWDKIALHKTQCKHPKLGRDEIWKYEILLRYAEYYTNNRVGVWNRLMYVIYKYRFHRLSIRLGFSIPVNDKGLSIAHYGSIVVNDRARIGKNCRIQENVTIGSTGGSADAPRIGDNVFVASGARIIGDIEIANGIAIGANAVVTKSFLNENITLAGIPAKEISKNGSHGFVCKELIGKG